MAAETQNTQASPNADDLMTFVRLMQAAEASRLNFPAALRDLAGKLPEGRAQEWANDLSSRMSRGHSLAEAVKSLEGIDETLAALVSVPGGFGFESLLTAYSRYLLLFSKLSEQIRTAVLYPLILLWIGFLNVTIMNVFVFPAMKGMFLDQKQTIPLAVRLLFVGDPELLPLSLVVPLIIAALAIMATHVWLFVQPHDMPATSFGKLLLLSQLSRSERIGRFQFLLALFLRAGYRLTDAIRYTAALGTGIQATDLIQKAERLERGEDISSSFAADAVLLPISGSVQSKTDPDDVADLLETASRSNIDAATRMIGRVESFGLVIGLCFAGVVVLFLTMAFFDPYFAIVRGAM